MSLLGLRVYAQGMVKSTAVQLLSPRSRSNAFRCNRARASTMERKKEVAWQGASNLANVSKRHTVCNLDGF
eukprot:4325804-Amphidinium_carterae.1